MAIKVKLFDYTGKGHPLPDYAARILAYTKNTRLEQGEDGLSKFMIMSQEDLAAELKYIANTLRTSWEFVTFTFQIIGVTRAFTHQLVRTRTASYAQQAQRVVDLSEAMVSEPETVASSPEAHAVWSDAVKTIQQAYSSLQKLGIPNQDCRGIVPTNIQTNIAVHMNLRVLADLVGKRQNLRAQGEYADVVRGMVEEVIGVMPWVEPFLYPERTATPALDAILKDALGSQSPIDVPFINDALKELDKLKGVWG